MFLSSAFFSLRHGHSPRSLIFGGAALPPSSAATQSVMVVQPGGCAWCWCCGFSIAAAIFCLDSSPPLMRYPARLLVRRASSVFSSFCCEILDASLCAASRLLAVHRLVCFFRNHCARMSTSASSSFRSSSFSSSFHFRAISLGIRSVPRPVLA